jgi:hypothetical protein
MSLENWTVGLSGACIGAALGAYFGHSFTIKIFNDRALKQKEAYYNEFKLLSSLYKINFPSLLDDYNKPNKDSFTSLPNFDTSILDNLILELSSSEEVLSYEQRLFSSNLKNMLVVTAEKVNKRDVEIDKLFKKERGSNIFAVRHHTSLLLMDAITLLFHTSKVINERANFIFGDYKFIDYAEVACRICEINFNKKLWKEIILGTGIKE